MLLKIDLFVNFPTVTAGGCESIKQISILVSMSTVAEQPGDADQVSQLQAEAIRWAVTGATCRWQFRGMELVIASEVFADICQAACSGHRACEHDLFSCLL
jgi:hypothetical protein